MLLVARSAGAASAAGPRSPLLVLHDQTDNAVSATLNSQNFEASNDGLDCQEADDFVVTGLGWTVSTVVAPGAYFMGGGPASSVHVTFYGDAGGHPGAVIPACDYPAVVPTGVASGSFTMTLAPACVLTPGIKWISVQANMDLDTSASPDQTFRLDGNFTGCNVNADCQNGTLCDGTEVCNAGQCAPGAPVTCEDGLFCTLDVCNAATGACSHPPNLCKDGLACTTDVCDEGTGSCLHADASVRFCNPSTIAIPAAGAGFLYPSPIVVSGLGTNGAVCSIRLNGIAHTFPDDLDILLSRGSSGPNALIVSDAGGSVDVAFVDLTLQDGAPLSLPDGGTLGSGTFKPTNWSTGGLDAPFPAPAPAIGGPSALSTFDGLNPNTTWNLWIRDEFSPDSGTISGGWCLSVVITSCASDADCDDANPCNGIETCIGGNCSSGAPIDCSDGLFCTLDSCNPSTGGCTHVANPCSDGDSCSMDACDEAANSCTHVSPLPIQFCSGGTIFINDGFSAPTVATPYPATIHVAGLSPVATSLCSVRLHGISHSFASDIDVLLTGPGTAQNAIILSDAGGNGAAVGATLTLKDAALLGVPAPLVTGTFKPTNLSPIDAFPGAPATSGASALAAFAGTNPNGDWSLYVVDDAAADSGRIAGGWCLSFVGPCTVDTSCTDENGCNGDEFCKSETCHPGLPLACDDGIYCTIDGCDAQTGMCTHVPETCDDGNACTADSCDEAGDRCDHVNACVQVCNTTPIAIDDGVAPKPAAPYPSVISLGGLQGTFFLKSIEIQGLTHASPDDIDMLLVPANSADTATILSDVGGRSAGVANVSFKLQDGAPAAPDSGPLVNGAVYAPTNVGPGTGTEAWPSPAPSPSGGVALSQFDGTDPNGDWLLYVVDDEAAGSGSIAGGWCLEYRIVCGSELDCDDSDSCTTDTCPAGSCVHSGPTPPAVNASVRLARSGPGTVVSWTDAPGPFNVYRGSRPGGSVFHYNQSCLFQGASDPMIVDPDPNPALGGLYFYLVSRSNPCAESSLGQGSSWAERTNASPCGILGMGR